MGNNPLSRSYSLIRNMNTTANKLYYINKQIGLQALSLGFVHFKKLMKIQFLKYGKTWTQKTMIEWYFKGLYDT